MDYCLPHASNHDTHMVIKNVLVLNGPGLADPSDFNGNSYGKLILDDIEKECLAVSEQLGLCADFRQTEDEQTLFRWIAEDSEHADALIINPVDSSRAASLNFEQCCSTIRSIAHLKMPVIEVHLENIFLPGSTFEAPIQIPEIEIGLISGLGLQGYRLAIQSLANR